jgi:hypothetical protein
LKDYGLGVKVEQRTEFDVTVISSFFDDYK